MNKAIKHHIRGAIYGSLLTLIAMGFVLYPHTSFRIQATNQPAEQLAAIDTAASLAAVMPSVKPAVKDDPRPPHIPHHSSSLGVAN